MSFRRIRFTVDWSAFAARATDVSLDLARSLGAEVAFIHVVDPNVALVPQVGYAAGDLIHWPNKMAERSLLAFRERAPL